MKFIFLNFYVAGNLNLQKYNFMNYVWCIIDIYLICYVIFDPFRPASKGWSVLCLSYKLLITWLNLLVP